jgi:hypothetical protein
MVDKAQQMDEFLSDFYGTGAAVKTAAANQEDLEKQASIDLFMKLATEQNIDLGKMEPKQVEALYSNWVKAASAPAAGAAEEEEEKEKHEEAKKEHEEKKAQAEKVAEADFLGRVMAHAYCQEMRKIAEAAADPAVKEAGKVRDTQAGYVAAKGIGHRAHEALKKGLDHVKGHMANTGAAAHHAAHSSGPVTEGKAKAIGAGIHAAGAAGAAGAGAAAAHHFGKDKEGSAIDGLAAEQAVKVAFEGNFDPEEAGRKIAAVLELGLAAPSEKIASAPDYAAAVGIRALELLEVAGYPVTWS